MVNLVNRLNIGPSASLVSVTKFANLGNMLWDFNRYQDKTSLVNAIRGIQHSGGNTNTSGGIYQLLTRVFTRSGGDRYGKSHVNC